MGGGGSTNVPHYSVLYVPMNGVLFIGLLIQSLHVSNLCLWVILFDMYAKLLKSVPDDASCKLFGCATMIS